MSRFFELRRELREEFTAAGIESAGVDADILILDRKLNVRCVWSMGREVEGTNKLV